MKRVWTIYLIFQGKCVLLSIRTSIFCDFTTCIDGKNVFFASSTIFFLSVKNTGTENVTL